MKRVAWLVIFLSVISVCWVKVGFAQESSRIISIQCDGPDVVPSEDAEDIRCMYAAMSICTGKQSEGKGGYAYNVYRPVQDTLVKVVAIEFVKDETRLYLAGKKDLLIFPWKNFFTEKYWILSFGNDDKEVSEFDIFYFYTANPGCAFQQPGCSKAVAVYVPDRYEIRVSNLFEFKGETEKEDVISIE